MELIASRNNPKIKEARALRQRKARQEGQAYLAEGIHLVGAAVEAGADLEAVFYAPDRLDSRYAGQLIEQIASQGVPCHPTSGDVFASLADKENPQGILAVVRQPRIGLHDLSPANFAWGVALVSPQDPGNLGAILRTIDAVGASGMLLLEGGVDAYHPTAVRASMGAIFRHPVVTASFVDFVRWSGEHGYHVYGTSAHAARDYRQEKPYLRPLILLLGSEREGLSPEQSAICEAMLRLPMHGRVTSLNLAVAAGVTLYAMLDSGPDRKE